MNEVKESLRNLEQKYKLFQQQQFTFIAALEHCRETAHDKIRPITSIEQVEPPGRWEGRGGTGRGAGRGLGAGRDLPDLPDPEMPGQHQALSLACKIKKTKQAQRGEARFCQNQDSDLTWWKEPGTWE